MTKIKSINPNQLYIAQNAEVSLKLAGNTAQVTFTASIVVFKYTHFIFAYDSICDAHVNRRSHRLRLIPLPCRVKSYPKYKVG
ncbi:MAG: hypothetical protein IIT65_11410, partial [Lachnospiraceae bacterium]|nr:hypothetical protein [Lachnospiraceae bacterium]